MEQHSNLISVKIQFVYLILQALCQFNFFIHLTTHIMYIAMLRAFKHYK